MRRDATQQPTQRKRGIPSDQMCVLISISGRSDLELKCSSNARFWTLYNSKLWRTPACRPKGFSPKRWSDRAPSSGGTHCGDSDNYLRRRIPGARVPSQLDFQAIRGLGPLAMFHHNEASKTFQQNNPCDETHKLRFSDSPDASVISALTLYKCLEMSCDMCLLALVLVRVINAYMPCWHFLWQKNKHVCICSI